MRNEYKKIYDLILLLFYLPLVIFFISIILLFCV
jgi:hypothetical protein